MRDKTKSIATAQGTSLRRLALLTLAVFTVASAALFVSAAFVANAQDKTTTQKTAPDPKLTTTTVADKTYGEGGSLETTSNEKGMLLREVWKDKDGKKVETFKYETLTNTFYKGKDEYHGDREKIGEWIEELEKQFAKDGTL